MTGVIDGEGIPMDQRSSGQGRDVHEQVEWLVLRLPTGTSIVLGWWRGRASFVGNLIAWGVLSVFVCVGGFRCSTRLEFQVGIRKVCVTCVSSPLEEFWKNLKLLKHGHGDGDGDGRE